MTPHACKNGGVTPYVTLLIRLVDRFAFNKGVLNNHPSQASAAARGLTYPVVVKPNIGGSGAGIMPFEEPGQLREACERAEIQLGIDHTALVQEYLPARGDSIVRLVDFILQRAGLIVPSFA